MAEHGAHVTSLGDDKPSVFEVLAQDGLLASLKPALKYALKILGQGNPARFGVLYRYADEIYAVFDWMLESFYLKHYSASFSENFYGMKRVHHSSQDQEQTSLPAHVRSKSLAFLVLVPYFKDKCARLYEALLDKQDRGVYTRQDPSFRLKLEKVFLRIYPYLHSLWQVIGFAVLVAYVVGHSAYHSPMLYLSGVTLQHLSEDDIRRHVRSSRRELNLHGKSLLRRVWAVCKYGVGLTAMGMSSVLSVTVFFLQFLEWWYSNDNRMTSLTTLPTPNPPPKSVATGAVPTVAVICPLCHKLRTNDTALAISGYVFCYPCIYTYVQQHGRCPVTSYPASTEHLVKLYIAET